MSRLQLLNLAFRGQSSEVLALRVGFRVSGLAPLCRLPVCFCRHQAIERFHFGTSLSICTPTRVGKGARSAGYVWFLQLAAHVNLMLLGINQT